VCRVHVLCVCVCDCECGCVWLSSGIRFQNFSSCSGVRVQRCVAYMCCVCVFVSASVSVCGYQAGSSFRISQKNEKTQMYPVVDTQCETWGVVLNCAGTHVCHIYVRCRVGFDLRISQNMKIHRCILLWTRNVRSGIAFGFGSRPLRRRR